MTIIIQIHFLKKSLAIILGLRNKILPLFMIQLSKMKKQKSVRPIITVYGQSDFNILFNVVLKALTPPLKGNFF